MALININLKTGQPDPDLTKKFEQEGDAAAARMDEYKEEYSEFLDPAGEQSDTDAPEPEEPFF